MAIVRLGETMFVRCFCLSILLPCLWPHSAHAQARKAPPGVFKDLNDAIIGDALIIRYFAPRKIIIPFSDVQDVRSVRLPIGGASLVIYRAGGRAIAIMPKDAEAFLSHLEAALSTKGEPPKPETRANASTPTRPRRPTRRKKT